MSAGRRIGGARGAARAAAAAFAIAAAIAAAHGCTERPGEPARSNPLDPAGDGGERDLLSLRATLTATAVNLFWQAIPVEGRNGYRIYRRAAGDAEFTLIDEAVAGAVGYRDAEPIHDALNIYAVTVVNGRREESSLAAFAADTVDVPPQLIIGTAEEPLDTTATRDVHVVFYSARAESVFVADSTHADPENGTQLAGATGYLPDPNGYEYRLGPGHGSDNTKVVHARVKRGDGSLSPIASATVFVRPLSIRLTVDGRADGPVATGRRAIAVAVASAAAESMETTFADSFTGAWAPFLEAFEESLAAPGPATLRVRVLDGFGEIAGDSIEVAGDDLAGARLSFDGDAAQTRRCAATVEARDGAVTRICLSASPIAAPGQAPCENLVPYTGPVADWPLPPCAQIARVYAVVANDWVPQGRVLDAPEEIFAVRAVPTVEFTTPSVSGDTIVVNEPVAFDGVAIGASCGDAVDSLSLYVRWIALDDTNAAPPDTLPLGPAALFEIGGEPGAAEWFLEWTPAAGLPPGRIEVIARVASGPCEGSRAVLAILAAARTPARDGRRTPR